MATVTHYPMQVELKLLITNGDQEGVVTYSSRAFTLPDEDTVKKAMEESLSSLPEGFRLMTRHESETYMIREKTGQHLPPFALSKMAKGTVWHDSETQDVRIPFEPSEDDLED